MSDQRLLDGEATEFESLLLRSVVNETPPAELSARMLAPVAGAGVATGLSLSMKWGLGLLALGAVGFGASFLVMNGADSSTANRELKPAGGAAVAPASTVDAAPGPESADPLAMERKEASTETAEGSGASKKLPATPTIQREVQAVKLPAKSTPQSDNSRQAKPQAGSTLLAEMRLLDEVRGALKKKQGSSALKKLAAYEAQFPQGTLRPEATVLRVKALEQLGEAADAESLKSEFLHSHPQSAHKKQLEGSGGDAR